MLNFAEMQTAVGHLIERPDSAFTTKIKEFINERYRAVVSLRPWMALLRPLQVTTIAASQYIFTPQEVDQIVDIHQETTPAIIALMRYYQHLNKNIDTLNNQDSPITAIPCGEVGILAAMPSDSVIGFTSDNAGDSTQTVVVRGYNTSKVMIQETVTLNGTSTVNTTNTFSSADGYEPKFSKSADTTGMVTAKSGSTTIAQIGSKEREVRYKKWRLWPVPNAAITLFITFKKKVYKLTQDEDTPEIECDNALIIGSFARSLEEKRQMSKATRVWGVKELDGTFPPGSYGHELDLLVAKEPQFSEGFQDQFTPIMTRDPIDQQVGNIGIQLRPGVGAP